MTFLSSTSGYCCISRVTDDAAEVVYMSLQVLGGEHCSAGPRKHCHEPVARVCGTARQHGADLWHKPYCGGGAYSRAAARHGSVHCSSCMVRGPAIRLTKGAHVITITSRIIQGKRRADNLSGRHTQRCFHGLCPKSHMNRNMQSMKGQHCAEGRESRTLLQQESSDRLACAFRTGGHWQMHETEECPLRMT